MAEKSKKIKSNYVNNVREIIENTRENIELSNLSLRAEANENIRRDIEAKNERRQKTINLMQEQIKDRFR